jgi:L-alanine-DL-glutamate epimerase-like enolase superfamily enzyme
MPSERVTSLQTSVFRVPTDRPEADGTITWNSTTMVLVEVAAQSGAKGIGFSYASAAAASLIHEMLEDCVVDCEADDRATWARMVARVRNAGRQGIAATAISAVDIALWDLRAKLAHKSLFQLLGQQRDSVPVYGSGGFTTYTDAELTNQLGGWVRQGIPRVKMKIGTDWGTRPEVDLHRVEVAREAIGRDAELFVDANGAYSPKQAIRLAHEFARHNVSYFEEPVSSDQLAALARIRHAVEQDVAAGEYGYDPWYFRAMLDAGAVDILQADATRCLGITGWLEAAALAHSAGILFSAHCGPSIHAQAACAAPQISHIEYFHDHVRIEHMLFDGALEPVAGDLHPDPSCPGLGLELKRADAARYAVC